MNNWIIGKKCSAYGKVAAMAIIEGEPYRLFLDKYGSVAMIPLQVLQLMEKREETKNG